MPLHATDEVLAQVTYRLYMLRATETVLLIFLSNSLQMSSFVSYPFSLQSITFLPLLRCRYLDNLVAKQLEMLHDYHLFR